MATIIINDALRAFIDPLTEEEYAALENSLLAEGCRDALVLWENILVDGHNRYAICRKHDLPYKTIQNTSFRSIDDVYLWMIDNHLGRRSVSDFQRGVLALRKKEILATRQAAPKEKTVMAEASRDTDDASTQAPKPNLTRDALARAARVSGTTLGHIEKIQKTATPELVQAVRSGAISISAAADVASLPEEKQLNAVQGGKKELRAAARQVREARVPSKPPAAPLPDNATPQDIEIHRLQQQLAELRAERDQLKQKVQHLTIALAESRGKP